MGCGSGDSLFRFRECPDHRSVSRRLAFGLETAGGKRLDVRIDLCATLGLRQVDTSSVAPRDTGQFRTQTQAVEMMADELGSRLALRLASRAQAMGEFEQFASDALGIGKAVGAVIGQDVPHGHQEFASLGHNGLVLAQAWFEPGQFCVPVGVSTDCDVRCFPGLSGQDRRP